MYRNGIKACSIGGSVEYINVSSKQKYLFTVQHNDVCNVCGGGVCGDHVSTGLGSSLLGTMAVGCESSSFLSLVPEVSVCTLHLLNHHDGVVICGVAWGVEIDGYWFLDPLVADIVAVSIEVDMEWILCLLHVLQFTFPALDEVDDVPCLAGYCCSYVVGAASSSAYESVLGPDVLAGLH